jgi:hypothetical protein
MSAIDLAHAPGAEEAVDDVTLDDVAREEGHGGAERLRTRALTGKHAVGSAWQCNAPAVARERVSRGK